jgi:sugar/nucleoside kinase (ribokinase family)
MNHALVVVGNISKDSISYQGVYKGTGWGGAGLNVSLSAAQLLGSKPRLVSIVGEDAVPLLCQIEKKLDISLVKIKKGKTCRFNMQYSHDGTLQDVICSFGVSMYMNSYCQTVRLPIGHYHVSCRRPLDPKKILPRIIIETNSSFSLDFILSSAHEQISLLSRCWLRRAKYVFVNSQELDIFNNLFAVNGIQTLVVTSADQPVSVLRFGHEILTQSCNNRAFHDVTGAGDVFIGAFLGSQLSGDELHTSIDEAILMAQQSLDDIGVARFLLSEPAQP